MTHEETRDRPQIRAEMLSEWAEDSRRWLEVSSALGSKIAAGGPDDLRALWIGQGGMFNALALPGLCVSLVHDGFARCSLRVPLHLTDGDGNWHAGSIAAAIDDVCAAAIVSADGIIKISVDFNISYYSHAKFNEEVEMEGRVVERKGMLTAAVTEIRKKATGELIAIGRQWMSASKGQKVADSRL